MSARFFSELDKMLGFPNSEIYAKKAISLPVYPGLTEIEQKEVIKKVKEVLYETKS